MRGRAFEWGPHSEDSSPATAGLGSSKPVHRPGADLVCLTWLWLYLRFTSPAPRPISQAGFCTSRLSFVFIFPPPLGTLCSSGFGVWAEKGRFCLSCSRTVGSVQAVKRPWVSKRFFFFNLKGSQCTTGLNRVLLCLLTLCFMNSLFCGLETRAHRPCALFWVTQLPHALKIQYY